MKYKAFAALLSTALIMANYVEAQQFTTKAQQLIRTGEDSLHAGISQKTVISGYGSAFYQRDFN
ncbi:MAG TPA: hypothetical protein VHC50_02715, partial [Puia sp.]|nr:hypothetical protein [Puia sp.]